MILQLEIVLLLVPGAAQLVLNSVELGIASAGGRGFTHEAGVPADALHGPWFPTQESMCKPFAFMAPWLQGSWGCAQTSSQHRQRLCAGADMPESAMLSGPPACLSLLSPWEPRMTLAGLEPAIFGSEDQCLIH